jgi:hypothetical protein
MGANPREMVSTPVSLEAAADGRVAGTLNLEIMIKFSHFVMSSERIYYDLDTAPKLLLALRTRNAAPFLASKVSPKGSRSGGLLAKKRSLISQETQLISSRAAGTPHTARTFDPA